MGTFPKSSLRMMKWNVGRYHSFFDICLCCTPILNVRGQPPEHVSILWSPNWSTRLANDYQQCLGCIGPWSLELLFVYVCVCVCLCLCCICSLYIFIYILCMHLTDYLRPNVAWPRDVVQSPPLNATHRHRSASHPIDALCTITQCSITKWCTPISNAYNAHCTFVLVPFLVFHSNWQPVPPHKFTVHYYTAMARRTIPLCKVYQCNEHYPSLSSSCM